MSSIFFDHRWCAPHGIGRFATELRNRIVGMRDLPIGGSPTHPADAMRLSRCLRRQNAGGFFSPGFNVPAWTRTPVISTIHDLIHVHFASEKNIAKWAYYRWLQRPIIQRSPVTLTVSEFSRRQIIEWYGIPESRVVCVGNGVSESFFHGGTAHASDRPYFLYVGNSKPHKNVDVLLRATEKVTRSADVSLMMVTANSPRLNRLIENRGISGHVQVVDKIDDGRLAELYRGAVSLVMPSYYEGFGLPIVEAMASGCPVIGSDRTSIPEVMGDAGLRFDPDDADQLAEMMASLLQNDRARSKHVASGLLRAAEYSWDKVACRVRSALRSHLPGISMGGT